MRIIVSIFVSLTFLFSNYSTADEIKLKSCDVTFGTIGEPVMIQISGSSLIECTGSLTSKNGNVEDGTFSLDLSKLDTGIELRNKHLRQNYLEVEKFPTAIISKLKFESLTKIIKREIKVDKFKAILTLHGVDKEVMGKYELIQKNSLKAHFTIDMLDFNMKRPEFMGVKVIDAVEIYVKLKFNTDLK